MSTYYQVLEVSQDATPEQIKEAYRNAALANHPDRNPNDKNAEAKMKKINEAYGVLGNEKRRIIYDQTLSKKNETRGVTTRKMSQEEIISEIQTGNLPIDFLIKIVTSQMISPEIRECAGYQINQILREIGMVEELFSFLKIKGIPPAVIRDGWNQIDQMARDGQIDEDLLSRMNNDPNCSKLMRRKFLERVFEKLIDALERENKTAELLVLCTTEQAPMPIRIRAGRIALNSPKVRAMPTALLELARNKSVPEEVRKRAGEIIIEKIEDELKIGKLRERENVAPKMRIKIR